MKKLFLFSLFCFLSVGVALPMENSSKKKTKISGEQAAAKYKYEKFPLHEAAINGDLAAVKYFIELKKYDVNVKSKIEWTTLHCAAEDGHLEVFKFLALMGEQFDAKDGPFLTRLDTLKEYHKEKFEQFIQWWNKNDGWLKVPKEERLIYFRVEKSLELKDFLAWKRWGRHFPHVNVANFETCRKDFQNRLNYVIDSLI